MDAQQAYEHNQKVAEKIRQLQSEMVVKFRVRVVERLEKGRRQNVIDEQTEFLPIKDKRQVYDNYRDLYPEQAKFLIVIDDIEPVKRSIQVRLPVRTDEDREPPRELGE